MIEVEILFFSNHLNHTGLEEISYIDYIQNAKDKTSYIEVVLLCLLVPFTFQEDLIWSFPVYSSKFAVSTWLYGQCYQFLWILLYGRLHSFCRKLASLNISVVCLLIECLFSNLDRHVSLQNKHNIFSFSYQKGIKKKEHTETSLYIDLLEWAGNHKEYCIFILRFWWFWNCVFLDFKYCTHMEKFWLSIILILLLQIFILPGMSLQSTC